MRSPCIEDNTCGEARELRPERKRSLLPKPSA